MRNRFKNLLAIATASLLATVNSASARDPISIEALSSMPKIQSVSMSSDGKNIVALIGKEGAEDYETSLATWQLDNLAAGPTVTASGDRMRFIAASALKADRVFVFARQEWTGALQGCGEGNSTGSTKTFVSKAYLTDTKHSEFSEAFAAGTRTAGVSAQTERCLELAGSASLVNGLPLDPTKVIVSRLNPLTFQENYYRYDLATDKTELLFRASGRDAPGLLNPRNGEVLTTTTIEPTADGLEQRIKIRKAGTDEFVVHPALSRKIKDRYTMAVVGLDEATGKYYVLTDAFSDLVQARMYDPATSKFDDEPLLAHPKYSIASIVLGSRPSDFNKVLGFTIANMNGDTVWIDPQLAAIHEGLKKAFPGQQVSIGSMTDDRNKILFTTESPRHPVAYRLLVDGNKVSTLGVTRDGIDPNDIGEQQWVTYKARDGLEIPAILDLPAGWTKADGPLPTVIHPHGGPWSRDFGGWDASGWVPFLTSRGYAVLRPQYRGSQGLGRKLWTSGDAEWGQKMQDDKDDGAAWLVQQGIADPKRMVMFGYSYGGFAAAAAVVRPNSPYRCAISGAPVTDLGRLGTSWSDNRLQRIVQGDTVKGMDPMQNTDKANIPVLLYVGDRDVRTPAFHARDFYNGVKDKVDAEFHLIPDMPHSMPWYPRHMSVTLGLMENFLKTKCGTTTGA
ncbi:alpha/beta hydrolase family protein [Arenimonas sp.]|uniref:alpha/beta hydrolase family protein n=1 Tax=Arenimonas sp. TaxID=1872635 RepID=UPI002E331FA6|nr:prolyl oligopeptidase family serine peptidase [Arenimonas sp.]HEX4853775.1 prolyl oligopeptidase family serine peptidase [Arenimonas sp.]